MSKQPLIYLDYAAATPVDPRVLAAMLPFFSEEFYNPSSVYLAATQVKDALEQARANVAHWLGARGPEITFTAGATEANNLAIDGIMRETSDEMIMSSIEHDAVLEPAGDYHVNVAGVDERGRLDLSALAAKITPKTRLVSIVYANNEIGVVQSLKSVAEIVAHERASRRQANNKTPIYLHTDASQAANYLDLHVDKLGVDLMTINGGKTYGPKQSGALYVRSGIELRPLTRGGGQEHGLRSGTQNVAFAVGLAEALDIAQKVKHDEFKRIRTLSDQLVHQLTEAFDDIRILGHKKHRLPNIIACVIPGIDGERALMALDQQGIMVGTGSACSALSDESSHVIKALGFSEEEARATLRISLGRHTTEQDLEALMQKLPAVIHEARELS